jgi:hypothetical protein
MDMEQFEALSKKLDAIIALLALDKLEGKSKTDSILLLNQLGLDNSTIASIVVTTPDAVAVRISEAKAKAKKTKEVKAVKKNKVVKNNNQENEQETVEGISS